ncbi:MAG: PD-(D/E)XK nuclease family protein [Sheuella sp.]|nr:PD-(D/E)XK nuclease family protein [Sheuella sp.]
MPVLKDLPVIDYTQLVSLPARATAVLTVNNRLARSVIQSLATHFARTSEIPLVAPWSGWLSHVLAQLSFEELIAAPAYVLDSFSAQMLWAQVIEDLETERPLLDMNQAAAAAMQADSLIDEWGIAVSEASQTEEYLSFERWRDAYRARLHALDAIDPNLLVERVILHLEMYADNPDHAGTSMPEHVVLAGFSEISPRMTRVLNALAEVGVSISILDPGDVQQSQLKRVLAAHAQAEWRSAAYWARQQLIENPHGRYAIVAAQLDREAPFARRVLDHVLGEGSETPQAFNVAVARPLSEWRAGRAMLAWLRTFVLMRDKKSAEPTDLGGALLSGHCAGDFNEMGGRARIDARWRDRQITRVKLSEWSRAIEPLLMLGPAWQRAWQSWQDYPRKADTQAWSQIFRATLSTLGFPGQAQQSSVAYQVTEALDSLLDRFAEMSPVLGAVSALDAWSALNRLARSATFQPQRDAGARLDVLGLLEAEGGSWDGVWMLGLTDEVLPAAAKPNPFIPLPALRLAQAPRATPEREYEWAQQIYKHLSHTAPEIIVSSAAQDGERSLRPSPLIAGVSEVPDIWTPQPISPHAQDLLQEQIDDYGPALQTTEVTAGGVSVLETQSCNPLWGFVRYRLGIQGLKAYATLPSKTLRGIYLHAVMQRIWEELRTQSRLLELRASGELQAWIDFVLHDVARQKLQDYPDMWQQLEQERSSLLIAQWLDLESKRLPFVATEVEQKRLMEIGTSVPKLKLELRLDRLDTLLSDERQVVIDYKSGAKLADVLKDWRQPRLVNLQLPSYAALMLSDSSANGLAQSMGANVADGLAGFILVQLHSKSVAAVGLIDEDIGLHGPKSLADAKFEDASWNDAMQRLHHCIERLADEFLQGVAVNQSFHKNDLKFCDVMPILRVYEEDQDD